MISEKLYISTKKDNILYANVDDRIPDDYDVSEYSFSKSKKIVIHFLKIPFGFRSSIKYWAEDEILIKKNSSSTVSAKVSDILRMIKFMFSQYAVSHPEGILDFHYSEYLDWLKEEVLNSHLELKTAHEYARATANYLKFLQSEEIAPLDFLKKYNISEMFPEKHPERFFSGDALKAHLKRIEEKRSERPLSYPNLIKIMNAVNKNNDVLFKNITIILAHTPLRLGEVLNLTVDCLEPVDDAEIKSALKSNRSGFAIDFDWSKSYWLSNYEVSKGKKRRKRIGTPILVSETVKKAVDRLIENGKIARQKKKNKGVSKMLCVGTRQENVISQTLYNNKRRSFIKSEGLPSFTAHQFRHTYAKLLYDMGISIDFIKKYLNHTHSDITSGYTYRDKETIARKYGDFANMKTFVGGGEDRAYSLQGKIKEAIAHPEFQAMALEGRSQLLSMITDKSGMDIHIMDHGICFLPKLTQCPHNYTEINSCMEEHCGGFVTTEVSTPFLADLIKNKKNAIADLEREGFAEAAEYNQKKLDKTMNIFEKLKKESQ